MLEAGPVNLNTIDEELCIHLGESISNSRWCRDWYNSIGLALAIGQSFDKIREELKACPENEIELLPIVDYLDANFVTDAWYQRGR